MTFPGVNWFIGKLPARRHLPYVPHHSVLPFSILVRCITIFEGQQRRPGLGLRMPSLILSFIHAVTKDKLCVRQIKDMSLLHDNFLFCIIFCPTPFNFTRWGFFCGVRLSNVN